MHDPPSRTAAHVRAHAERTPDAVALIANGEVVTYARFSRDLDRFVCNLRGFGLAPGRAAAVACEDVYVHWLILLAFERLGVLTVSFRRHEGPEAADGFALVELVLWDEDAPPCAKRRHRITPDWIQQALSGPADDGDDRVPAPCDPMRILRTSGTTGGSKSMIVLRRMQEARIAQRIANLRLTPRSRYVMTMHLTVHSVYAVAYACLWLGATVVFDDRLSIAETLAACDATHATLLPVYLSGLLDDLADDYRPPARLIVWSIGARLHPGLRERARTRLGAEIVESYGANETGTICVIGEDGEGRVVDGVEVEVVDEAGRPVPPGEAGAIRIRAAGLIQGYLDNPEADAAMFRDGWFHPGDIGRMPAPRRVRLCGRAADLVNFGGLKTSCLDLESAILAATGARDAAVMPRGAGSADEEVCVAVVLPLGAGEAEAAIRAALPGPVALIVAVETIPRNAHGKIDRARLAALFPAIENPRPTA